MEKLKTTRLRVALLGVALLLAPACGSTAQSTATDGTAATGQSAPDSAPVGEIRLDGAPLASKMGVCDAVDPALVAQWVGIEEMIYASFGSQSDGCQWIGDNWDTTHSVASLSMIVHSQQSFEAKTATAVPFIGGPEGALIHNNVHVYIEHEGTFVSFWVIPTREEFDDSTAPADHPDLYNEIVGPMLDQLDGIAKA